MTDFSSIDALRHACEHLPGPDLAAAAAVRARQAVLTKPPGSLGRLEDLAAWLAQWQRRPMPRLDHVAILVFAGNHGVAARGVSSYPAEVTAQMVGNFGAGGAAINQLAANAGAALRVVPLALETATADFTEAPAMSAAGFLDAVRVGHDAVEPGTDLLCLGEMGIGNTTAAAAIAAALQGGDVARWVGRGTGVDDAGLLRKQRAIESALAHHRACLGDPLQVARRVGGFELAALLGAALAARHAGIPVLLDGFVVTAAVAPLAHLRAGGLDHTQLAHVSAEAGHSALARALGLSPLLDLGLRLGEGSGAALAVPLLRAAVACHQGMASFSEAGVSDRAERAGTSESAGTSDHP